MISTQLISEKVKRSLRGNRSDYGTPDAFVQQISESRLFLQLHYDSVEETSQLVRDCKAIKENLKEELTHISIDFIRFLVKIDQPSKPYKDFEFDYMI